MHSLLIAFFLVLALPLPSAAAVPEIRALTPSSGDPGTEVSIRGGPFAERVRVQFGENLITPQVQSERRLVFTVPDLEAGDYLINLVQDDGISERNFLFRVIEPAPRIESINPSNLDECSVEAERLVTISGRNFHSGSTVLLDDAAVPKESASRTGISFTVPPLKGGPHEVKVINPSDKSSLAHTLFVNTIPEILSVSEGSGQVNHYELTISGKNFQHDSILYVNGRQVTDPSMTRPKSDYVTYVDCRTLTYTRYPVTWELQRISLQVVNPGGEESPVFYVTVP